MLCCGTADFAHAPTHFSWLDAVVGLLGLFPRHITTAATNAMPIINPDDPATAIAIGVVNAGVSLVGCAVL